MAFPVNLATDAFAITASDTTNFTQMASGIFVGVAGTVAVVTEQGNVVSFIAPAGGILPISAKRVNATGTTATDLVGMVR